MLSQVDHRTLFPISYPQIQANKSSFAFSSDVPKEFSPGNVLVLKGTPVANARGGFAFAFLIGKTQREAFQFSVRFSNNIVVRNHSADGKYVVVNYECNMYLRNLLSDLIHNWKIVREDFHSNLIGNLLLPLDSPQMSFVSL